MFLLQAKTLFLEAIQNAFDADYPDPLLRGLWISMEYPVEPAQMPGIWVDFTPTAELQIAGISHHEDVLQTDGTFRRGTRWRFGGHISYTVTAMTSRERDKIADEVIRVLAFGGEYPTLSEYRKTLEANDLIQVSMQWDTFSIGGKDEAPGTPWGSDEMVYEITVGVDCQGSFISGSVDGPLLLAVSQVIAKDQGPGESPPDFPTSPVGGTPAPNEWQ